MQLRDLTKILSAFFQSSHIWFNLDQHIFNRIILFIRYFLRYCFLFFITFNYRYIRIFYMLYVLFL